MTKIISICTVAVLACAQIATAQLAWTGAASTDIYDIANWDTTNSSVVGPLAANTTINDNIVVTGNFANNPTIPDLPAQVRFQIGDNYGLTLDGATWDLAAGANDGMGGDPAGMGPMTIDVTNGSSLTAFFIVNHVSMSIDATSSVTLGGGGNPVNNGAGGPTTIDMMPGATLSFTAETPQQFMDEHLSKILVGGQPAADGVNIEIVADGGAGAMITAMVPEPSSGILGMILLPLAIAGLRRRRNG